jgi:hypothetical protein
MRFVENLPPRRVNFDAVLDRQDFLRSLLLSLSAALLRCAPKVPAPTRVARAMEVPPTGDRALDGEFERVRAMQITVNESDREYLESLVALAARLSASQDPELPSVAGALRRRADELFDRGRALLVEFDTSAAERALEEGDERLGCDRFTRAANVHRCQTDLARTIPVVVRERPAQLEVNEDEDEPRRVEYPETTLEWALAARVAISELIALRLRLAAVVAIAEPAKQRLSAARVPRSHERERRDAVEFLTCVGARARVQRRMVTTGAETLINALQRTARVRGA